MSEGPDAGRWLELVDTALRENDTQALSRAYYRHARGHAGNLRAMVQRVTMARPLLPETRNYMALLLWKLGEDLADVRQSLGFGALDGPDAVERHVQQMCETKIAHRGPEWPSMAEIELQSATDDYILRLARLAKSVRGDPLNTEELRKTIKDLADGLEPYEETMGILG